jgi:hypothetical protein
VSGGRQKYILFFVPWVFGVYCLRGWDWTSTIEPDILHWTYMCFDLLQDLQAPEVNSMGFID